MTAIIDNQFQRDTLMLQTPGQDSPLNSTLIQTVPGLRMGLISGFLVGLLFCTGTDVSAEIPPSKWKPVEIDRIQVGYGVQLADVDGDGKTDIVLADKKTIQWYHNPSWKKHIIALSLIHI